jgi:tetratricopeptide (TPR) repeat protein
MSRRDRRLQDKINRKKNAQDRRASRLHPPHVLKDVAVIGQKLDVAVQHHSAGRLDQAARIYTEILAAHPEQPDALQLLGMVAYQEGRNQAALEMLNQAVALDPTNEAAFINQGTVLHATGEFVGAAASYRKALEINPDSFEALNNLGNALAESGDAEAAASAYEKALAIQPDAPVSLVNFAIALCDLNRPDDAIASADRAIALKPDYAEAYNTRGNALGMVGRLDDAMASYRQALAIKPAFAEALWHVARLKEFSERDHDIEAMEVLVEQATTTDTQRMHLSFSLCKAFEDLHQYDDAYHYLETANRLKRATLNFDIASAEQHFAATAATFSEEFFLQHADSGLGDETPVFIVGMPRSGSTLVEQILSSHHDVHGAGELSTLRSVVSGYFGPFNCGNPIDGVHAMASRKIRQAGEDYMSAVRRIAPERRFVTDKMLHNFELIGMIRLLFPKAKVINCTRDPVDNCFSLYKIHFSANAYHYAYDPIEIAKYYKLYTALMAHWAKVLPGFVFNVGYEDLVENQRDVTESLLDYCGLDWDEGCMSFHKTARTVKTASFAQVRKPVYQSSVGLAQQYRTHMSAMIAELEG